jgi:hypothetical protein
VLAEAVLATCIFVPLIVFIVWGVLEVAYAYVIGINMTEAAQVAARALSDEFLKNPTIAQSPSQQQAILQRVRIPLMVSSNNQFSLGANAWVTKTIPRSVTVSCTYMPGEGNPALPPFPNPDILNCRDQINITSSSTSPLY